MLKGMQTGLEIVNIYSDFSLSQLLRTPIFGTLKTKIIYERNVV